MYMLYILYVCIYVYQLYICILFILHIYIIYICLDIYIHIYMNMSLLQPKQ